MKNTLENTGMQPVNQQYRIFDELIEGVQVIDKEWRYRYINKSAARQGKSSVEKLLNSSMKDNYSKKENSELFNLIQQCMNDGSAHRFLNKFKFPNGSNGYFELRIQQVPEGVLVLSTDVTQLKSMEHQLKNLNELLENVVKERTSQLVDSLERELKIVEEKSQFIAVTSHELKTPLAAIEILLNILEKSGKPVKDEEKAMHFQNIRAQLHDMNNKINHFKLLAQQEHDRTFHIKGQEIGIKKLIASEIDKLKFTCKSDQQIDYKHFGNSTISMNEHMLRSIVSNLISNAVKYSENNVELQTELDDAFFVIRVMDDGIGIPKNEQKNLFKKYFRAENTGRIKGTGLGLNIVKRYVELMNGRINIFSEENYGTSVEVQVPNY